MVPAYNLFKFYFKRSSHFYQLKIIGESVFPFGKDLQTLKTSSKTKDLLIILLFIHHFKAFENDRL